MTVNKHRHHHEGIRTARMVFWLATMLVATGFLPGPLVLVMVVVSAEKDSNPYPWGANPNNALRMYWNDASNVLQDLDGSFQALYVRYHGCVWSECTVDAYDDDGENRDGDEYWYQDRTQSFCANAAYSLHGVLRDNVVLPWDRCSRGTYINSFFTYGGADTLLEPYDDLIASAQTIFDDYGSNNGNNNNNNNNNNGGSSSSSHPNAVCYAQGGNNNNNNNNNKNNNNNNNNNNNGGYSTTMGCSADGKNFVAAMFTGQVCEGSNYYETVDDMVEYNDVVQRNFNCKQIYNRRRDSAAVRAYYQSIQAQQEASSQGNNNKNNNGGKQRRGLMVASKETNSTEAALDADPSGTTTASSVTGEPLRGGGRMATTASVVGERELGNNNNDDGGNGGIAVPDIPAWTILSQSWSCDVNLYPNQMCPDPYRLKRRYDMVLTAAARGRPGGLARFHYRIARFLRLGSAVALFGGIVLYISSYYVSRRESFKTVGFCTTICADMRQLCLSFGKLLRKCCRSCVNVVTGKTRRQRRAAAAAAAARSSSRQRSSSNRSLGGDRRLRGSGSNGSSATKKKKKKSDSGDRDGNGEKKARRSKSSSSRASTPRSPNKSSSRSRSSKKDKDDTARDYFAFF